jgi:hypothetical protein
VAKPKTQFLPSFCFDLIKSAISCATALDASRGSAKILVGIFSYAMGSLKRGLLMMYQLGVFFTKIKQ